MEVQLKPPQSHFVRQLISVQTPTIPKWLAIINALGNR